MRWEMSRRFFVKKLYFLLDNYLVYALLLNEQDIYYGHFEDESSRVKNVVLNFKSFPLTVCLNINSLTNINSYIIDKISIFASLGKGFFMYILPLSYEQLVFIWGT